MKLHCKCGQQLTRSMFPSKDWTLMDVCVDDDGYEFMHDYEKLKGSFQYADSYWQDNAKEFWLNKDSLTIELPAFRSGMGCCDLSGEPVKCPSCDSVVGMANLDCHESKHIALFESAVDRVYRIPERHGRLRSM